MTLLIITIILFAILFIGLLGYAIYADKVGTKKSKKGVALVTKSKKYYRYVPLSFLSFLLLLTGVFTSIPANSVGIIYNEVNGGIQEETYGEGFHGKSVFEHITTISTANKSAKIKTTGQTNDGQYATIELSLIYKIEKQNAGKFYKVTNADDISENAINTIVKSSLQSSTIKYNIFELLSTQLENARLDFKNSLSNALSEKYFITVVDVAFDDIDGGQEVENILQASAKAQQEIDIAKLDAQSKLISANNEAEVKRVIADATAYAITQEGSAQGEAASAYVNKITGMIDNLYTNMQGTLTYKECSEMVLSIVFYDTWNGQLPEVLTSDSLSSMIGSLISNKDQNNG